MLTVILKRSEEPKVIQMTQEDVIRQMRDVLGAELLLEDTWTDGLRKVRTPFVCLMEADCVLSASYLSSNVGLMKKTEGSEKGGGYMKLAMLASCLGYRDYANRIYNYELEQSEDSNGLTYFQVRPCRDKRSTSLYAVQVGFVPGAIIRYSSIKDSIDKLNWDEPNLVKLSTDVSFHFWDTGRRVNINPNTTYVSGEEYLEDPPNFDWGKPIKALSIFTKEQI